MKKEEDDIIVLGEQEIHEILDLGEQEIHEISDLGEQEILDKIDISNERIKDISNSVEFVLKSIGININPDIFANSMKTKRDAYKELNKPVVKDNEKHS